MRQIQEKYTSALLLVVLGLGVFSVVVLVTDPSPSNPDLNSTLLDWSANRNPASQISTPEAAPERLFKMDCKLPDPTLETQSIRIQLQGESCYSSDAQPFITEVKNKTNGYVATVFLQGENSFKTDNINLNQGLNEIEVRFETEKGMIQKTLMITRVPESKK